MWEIWKVRFCGRAIALRRWRWNLSASSRTRLSTMSFTWKAFERPTKISITVFTAPVKWELIENIIHHFFSSMNKAIESIRQCFGEGIYPVIRSGRQRGNLRRATGQRWECPEFSSIVLKGPTVWCVFFCVLRFGFKNLWRLANAVPEKLLRFFTFFQELALGVVVDEAPGWNGLWEGATVWEKLSVVGGRGLQGKGEAWEAIKLRHRARHGGRG